MIEIIYKNITLVAFRNVQHNEHYYNIIYTDEVESKLSLNKVGMRIIR